MDHEDIIHTIKASDLVSSPRNIEHFEAQLMSQLQDLLSELPFDCFGKGGYCPRENITVTDLEITSETPVDIGGRVLLELIGKRPDDVRKMCLDFVFVWEAEELSFRCLEGHFEM